LKGGPVRLRLPPTPAKIAAWGSSSKSQPRGGPSGLQGYIGGGAMRIREATCCWNAYMQIAAVLLLIQMAMPLLLSTCDTMLRKLNKYMRL